MRHRALPGVSRPRRGAVPAVLLSAVLCLVAMGAGAEAARLDCRPLAARAEARLGVPRGLLQAIALAESGIDGRAWPWTVNAGGKAAYLRDEQDAERVAAAAVRRFGGDVALGCMQLVLRWHGRDFTDLRDMLDPVSNVDHAAGFLIALRRRYGSWEDAVRRYHAADRAAQDAYLCRVLSMRILLGFQTATAPVRRLCPAAPGREPPTAGAVSSALAEAGPGRAR
jgi:soluble lytic murein transglycosylase-like protein